MRNLVILWVVLAVSNARADELADRTKAIDAMLAAQTKALIKNDEPAMSATMTKDGERTFDSSAFDANSMWGFPAPSKIVVTARQIGWAGTWGWLAAEMRVTGYVEPGTPKSKARTDLVRWIAIVQADGAAVKTRLLVVLSTERTGPDSSDRVQQLIANPKPPALAALLANPTALATQIANEPNAAVFGSDPKEIGLGAAKAKKLASTWSKLTFEVADTDGTTKLIDKKDYIPVERALGDAAFVRTRVRYMNNKTKRWVELDAVLVARKVGDRWQPVVAAYGPP